MRSAWHDRRDAASRIECLISDFAEAHYYVLDAKAHDEAEAAGFPATGDTDDYKVLDANGVDVDEHELETAALERLEPAIRELCKKQNPEAFAYVEKAEAEHAAEVAEREAEARAAGFESVEAQREANAKAKRADAAKRGAETRKAMRDGGYAAVRALEEKRQAERLERWAVARGYANHAEYEAAEEAKQAKKDAEAQALGFADHDARLEAEWQARQAAEQAA